MTPSLKPGSESGAVSKQPLLAQPQGFLLPIVGAVAFAHLLNDSIQAVVAASYPMLKEQFSLSFAEIGWIAMIYQLTASLLQPWIGLFTDKRPQPYLLPLGMVVTLVGIGLISIANSFVTLLLSASLIGVGSSTFHPEASRIARQASGGRFGTAQSLFQVGGNAGSALGPLIAALIIVPNGQRAIAWGVVIAGLAVWVLMRVTRWRLRHVVPQMLVHRDAYAEGVQRSQVARALLVICILMFAKFVYIAAISNYFTFYMMERFGVSIRVSQLYLFAFMGAVAVGTFAGGPIGDRIGRKKVIWISFLGVAPFALLLPPANLYWTLPLAVMVGLIMSSAFATMVVYVQELLPGRVGMVAGLMFGLMFGISGMAAAGLGYLADLNGIVWVYQLCAFLPLLGFATALLPDTKH